MVQTQNLLNLKSDWTFKRIFTKEGNENRIKKYGIIKK